MKDLILTAQDARELQSLGALTITKPIKPAPPYVEGAVFALNTLGAWYIKGPDSEAITADEFVPPVRPGDAVMIREPWRYNEDESVSLKDFLLRADFDEEQEKDLGKWNSPVSMPTAAAARYARVESVAATYTEAGGDWLLTLQLIDKDTAQAIDAGLLTAKFTTGACKYCGQTAELGQAYDTQEAADEAASELCECTSATIARRRAAQVEDAKDRVRQLFGERAEELGFVPLADAPAVELLEQIAALIATGPISSATINVRGRCKAKLTVSTKGKIKVSRSEVKSCDLEAGE